MIDSQLSPIAEELVSGWIPHFKKADEAMIWLDAEREFALPLDKHTLLVGRVDDIGITEEYAWVFRKNGVWTPECAPGTFFMEIKSQKAPPKYAKDDWKLTWRMNPQSLTYGVSTDILYPGTRRFTVRKAFKSSPPTFDHEWFEYSTAEIEWWRGELLNIADEIRARRKKGELPWSPNFNNCFKYGMKYACSRFNSACSKMEWDGKPVGWMPREPHLEVEKKAITDNTGSFQQLLDKNLVILDASRVDTFVECREKYRGRYEAGVSEEPSEAITIGKDLHSLLKVYYSRMIPKAG